MVPRLSILTITKNLSVRTRVNSHLTSAVADKNKKPITPPLNGDELRELQYSCTDAPVNKDDRFPLDPKAVALLTKIIYALIGKTKIEIVQTILCGSFVERVCTSEDMAGCNMGELVSTIPHPALLVYRLGKVRPIPI